jgi:hypothetical protein
MEIRIFHEIIAIIRTEANRRDKDLKSLPKDAAYDHWLFVDQPFVNELCLMLLVSLSHQVESELVLLVERIVNDTRQEIAVDEYRVNVEKRRKHLKEKKGNGWVKLYKDLGVKSGEPEPLKVLRLLANSYKHDPFMLPDTQLLTLLKLPDKREFPCRAYKSKVVYASLSESCLLQKGLANFFHLAENADYCDIAAQFVDFASRFLAGLKNNMLATFEQKLVNLVDFAQ